MTTRRITPQAKKTRDIAELPDVNPLLSLRNNIDRIFETFLKGFDPSLPVATSPMFYPNVDVSDSGKEIKVTVELPGMDEKDIDVALTRDLLTIRGEKKDETIEEGGSYHRTERVYGFFSRSVPLPVEVNVDDAKASYKRGVLTIAIPKTEKTLKEEKKIPVKRK